MLSPQDLVALSVHSHAREAELAGETAGETVGSTQVPHPQGKLLLRQVSLLLWGGSWQAAPAERLQGERGGDALEDGGPATCPHPQPARTREVTPPQEPAPSP